MFLAPPANARIYSNAAHPPLDELRFSFLIFCSHCFRRKNQRAGYAAVNAEPGRDDIIFHPAKNLRMLHVAVEHFAHLPANHREEVLLLHHAAAQHDLLRRKHKNRRHAHLRQIIALQHPGGMIRRKLLRGLAPAFENRRTAGHAFQTAVVERAGAVRHRIVRMRPQPEMAKFRMNQSMDNFVFHHNTRADARTNRHVNAAGQPLRRAHTVFGDCRRVHIVVVAAGYADRLAQFGQERIVRPALLGRTGNVTVRRRILMQVDRTKAGHAQRVDRFAFEKLNQPGHRFRRGKRRIADAGKYTPRLIADGADHFRSAGFQCAKSHLYVLLFI